MTHEMVLSMQRIDLVAIDLFGGIDCMSALYVLLDYCGSNECAAGVTKNNGTSSECWSSWPNSCTVECRTGKLPLLTQICCVVWVSPAASQLRLLQAAVPPLLRLVTRFGNTNVNRPLQCPVLQVRIFCFRSRVLLWMRLQKSN